MDGTCSSQAESGKQKPLGMILKVTHKTTYTYSEPVFLEPHILRMRPRNDASQNIKNFTLTVKPPPAGEHHFLDSEGNNAACLWFEEKTASLSIFTSFEAQLFCINPFNYLVTDNNFFQLPVTYNDFDATALQTYLAPINIDDEVTTFSRSIHAESGGNTLDFLSGLCRVLYENFKVIIREHGPPLPPPVTFQNKSGACRDLTLLYMAICRSFGLAARYVSGYQEGDPLMDRRHLHAWAEIYIPGGGWRGYDPSHGLAVTDRHIALAASYDPAGVTPIKGNFRGTGVKAIMDHNISLSAVRI